jgi:hypothetical protein
MNKIKTRLQTFKLETGYNNDPEKRGPLIRKVDKSFEVYDLEFKNATTPHDQCILTMELYLACTRWLKKKEGKLFHRKQFGRPPAFARTPTRREWVTKVAKECLVELEAEGWLGADQADQQARVKFDKRKLATHELKPQQWRTTLPLHGTYGYERETWLESKKKSALSATAVREELRNAGQSNTFDQLTLKDYKKWAKKDQVAFFDKRARLKHMVDIDANGLLCNAKTMALLDFNVPKLDFSLDQFYFSRQVKNNFEPRLSMYAMDRYGNLFQSPQPSTLQIRQDYGAEFYNHSTFNAGHKVICSGMIGINQGKLVWIDNSSGHYQPTMDNLKEAVGILDEEEVDLTETVVGSYSFGNASKAKVEYFKADVFLSDGKPFFTF